MMHDNMAKNNQISAVYKGNKNSPQTITCRGDGLDKSTGKHGQSDLD